MHQPREGEKAKIRVATETLQPKSPETASSGVTRETAVEAMIAHGLKATRQKTRVKIRVQEASLRREADHLAEIKEVVKEEKENEIKPRKG